MQSAFSRHETDLCSRGARDHARNFTVQASATIPLLDSVIFIRAQRLVHGQTRMPWQSRVSRPPSTARYRTYTDDSERGRLQLGWIRSVRRRYDQSPIERQSADRRLLRAALEIGGQDETEGLLCKLSPGPASTSPARPAARTRARPGPGGVVIAAFALSAGRAAARHIADRFQRLGDTGIGTPYLFTSLTAVIVGGTSIVGARGDYWRTVIGAIMLTVINTVLLAKGYSAAVQQILFGVIILVAALAYGRETRLRDRV